LDLIDRESLQNNVKFRKDSHCEAIDQTSDEDQLSPLLASSPSNSAIIRPIIDPADLIGRSFLKDQDNREHHRLHIVQLLEDHLNKAEGNTDRIKYLCKINEGNCKELLAYNEILNYLENQEHDDLLWNFWRVSHKGPLMREHPDYKGLSYNVKVEWENREITSEPLNVIATNDPVTCVIYARENALLDLLGWKCFNPLLNGRRSTSGW
jgi:hypothetical protein